MNRSNATPDAITHADTGAEASRRAAATVGTMATTTRNIALCVTDPRLAMQERRADKEERMKYGEA